MIAYLHQSSAHGAVERYLEQLLSGLEEDAVVIAPRGADLLALRPYDPTASTPSLLLHLVRELRALRPRLVHVVDVWPLALVAAWVARVPRTIVTHHTPGLPRRDNRFGRLLWRLGWWTRPEVIYTSAADRAADARDGVVIPLGIELERFGGERRPEALIGTVARLVEQKGIDTLLASVPRVLERHPALRFAVVGDGPLRTELERHPALRFAVVGDGPLRTELERLAAGLPVEFLGQRDDVPQQLARFLVFVLPTRFEGLCLAVIEAQAAGVPVVATPVGGIVETVVPGETGRLVPLDDPDALADAIVGAIEDMEGSERMAAEARVRVRARFAVEAMIEATRALYC